MKQDIKGICLTGQVVGPRDRIFQEVSADGEPQNTYIALNAGKVLPKTTTPMGFWRKRTIYDLHAGIS